MKICKNCGRQTDDSKVRCPHCGYLFEENMDSVIRKMKENLNTYKGSVASTPAPAAAAQPVAQAPVQSARPVAVQPAAQAPVQAQPPVQPVAQQEPVQSYAQTAPAPADNSMGRYELLSEVAQLKGELRALHTELDRSKAAIAQPAAQPVQYVQPAQYVQPPVQYIQPPVQYMQPQQPQTVIYANSPYPAQPAPQVYVQTPQQNPQYVQVAAGEQAAAEGKKKKSVRSTNRIVISVISILLLALSVGMCFLPWISMEDGAFSFTGWEGISYLFNKDSEGAILFAGYLQMIEDFNFAGGEMIANVCRTACRYIVEYGIIVYAAFLVLSIPLLLSITGKISGKGWHRFASWMSFIVALILFGVFCWITGFSSITIWFLRGAAANLVRCLFLAFYKGKKLKGGLE